MIALAFKIAAQTSSEWSKLIAAATHSPYSHVELWVGGERGAALCWSSREFDGVALVVLDLEQPEWEIVEIGAAAGREAFMAAFIAGFCAGANGKSYDTLGLLGYKTGSGQHDDHDVFCSEFCASALAACGALTLPRAPWLISPGDLYGIVSAAAAKP